MEKLVYVVRHCEAEGQSPHARLTGHGKAQAEQLVAFFDEIEIDQIIVSPFVRTRCTALPLAESKGLCMEQNSNLTERVLSTRHEEDWLKKLKDSFSNVHLKYKGGESSIEAMTRVYKVVKELQNGSRTVIVTHGNLMTLLLRCFDKGFGFEEWKSLTNPDVYLIKFNIGEVSIQRIWDKRYLQ